MTLLLEEPTAQDDLNAQDDLSAQLLFKEARRRRRRLRVLWMATGATVIAVSVGLGLTLDRSSSPPRSSAGVAAQTGSGWPPHLRTGATLVYALNDLRIIDADTGATRVLPMPAPYGGSRDLAMVTVGRSFLLNRGNTAWLYSGSTDGKPVDLGPSDGVLRGPNSNQAWVWTQPCDPILGCTDYNAPQMGSVHLVDGAGRSLGAAVALPGVDGWYPTGVAGKAGIVLQQLPPYGNHSNLQELWNPLTDRVVHVFVNAGVWAIGGNTVVWQTAPPYCGKSCPLHVLNALNGLERTVRLPSGISGGSDAAISPDGRTIAIAVELSSTLRVPYPGAVLLIGPHSQAATMLAGSEQPTNPNLGPMSLTWSSNGWLFSSTVGKTTVEAWRPGTSRARVLPKLRLPKFRLVNEDPSLLAL
jgi:hypothetical protein